MKYLKQKNPLIFVSYLKSFSLFLLLVLSDATADKLPTNIDFIHSLDVIDFANRAQTSVNATNTQVNSNTSQIQSLKANQADIGNIKATANAANNTANKALSEVTTIKADVSAQNLLIQNNANNINQQNDKIQDIFASTIATSSLPTNNVEKGKNTLGLGIGGTDNGGSALAIGYGHTLNYTPKNIFGGQSSISIKANAVITPSTKAVGTGIGITW